MSEPTIRQAREADTARLAALNCEFNGQECGWGLTADRATGTREVVLVAECEGLVVGFACLQLLYSACYPQPWAELTELYVTPAARGRGAGAALAREAERCARDAAATELLLRTNARNDIAQRLFVRAGLAASGNVVYRKALRERSSGATV
jgi:GNAT superfamily N-acetyltransferase